MAAAAPVSALKGQDDVFFNQRSRQTAVFGTEVMGKLVALDVLVIGLGGVGVETGACVLRFGNLLQTFLLLRSSF